MAVAVCALPVVGLLATAVFAPLPFSVAQPGMTANVLGENKGDPVITISGAEARKTSGQLRMTTIEATGPDTRVGLGDVLDGWFRTDQAVMPREAVYPSGDTAEEIQEYNAAEMKESQDTATEAALAYLGEDSGDIEVTLRLADVGGPSAGLLFSSASSTNSTATAAAATSRAVASSPGRGPSTRPSRVGAVGGVTLKTQAARRDGATVFLVPKAECSDAKAELPKGLRLIPVTTLKGAVGSLVALETGKGSVPSC